MSAILFVFVTTTSYAFSEPRYSNSLSISSVVRKKSGGCSEASSPNYPLFINGTELLVFLRDYDGSGEKYHPITDYNTVLYAVYDENGHRYFLDSFGTMSAQDTLTPGRTTLSAQELTQLTARIAQTDPVLSNAVAQANQNQEAVIYRQSDLEELFKSLS